MRTACRWDPRKQHLGCTKDSYHRHVAFHISYIPLPMTCLKVWDMALQWRDMWCLDVLSLGHCPDTRCRSETMWSPKSEIFMKDSGTWKVKKGPFIFIGSRFQTCPFSKALKLDPFFGVECFIFKMDCGWLWLPVQARRSTEKEKAAAEKSMAKELHIARWPLDHLEGAQHS